MGQYIPECQAHSSDRPVNQYLISLHKHVDKSGQENKSLYIIISEYIPIFVYRI